jgi:hypothetical protein
LNVVAKDKGNKQVLIRPDATLQDEVNTYNDY